MAENLSVEQKIQNFIKQNPQYKNKSKSEIVSIMCSLGVLKLTAEQKISILQSNIKKTNTGLEVEISSNKKPLPASSNKLMLKTADGKEVDFNKILSDRVNSTVKEVEKAEKGNSVIGSMWSGFKNLTGIGDSSDKVREINEKEKKLLAQFNNNPQKRSEIFKELTGEDYNDENLEKFVNGEIKLKSETALQAYKEGQDMAVDITADIVSGVAAFGIYTAAVAAAPFTGGASIAVGIGAAALSGAAIKSGVKALDAATGDKEYTAKDFAHDAATGAFSGVLAPVTAGAGGAVGKAVATKIGLQVATTAGKEVVKSTTKQAVVTAVKQGAVMASEMATDGALAGGVDNAFRTALDGGSVSEVAEAAVTGAIGGMVLSPVIGGGLKGAGKVGEKIVGYIPFGKVPTDVPQVVIPKKTMVDLYPESDAAALA